MTTIDQDADVVTVINTFIVDPAKQQTLVDMLEAATEAVMRRQPVSANIHRSLDGTKVANYAQWRSVGEFEAMMGNRECAEHIKAVAALVERFDPVLYHVAGVHD